MQDDFDIISFTPTDLLYYGASIKLPEILLQTGKYTKHTDINIPLGHSRYGGPIADLPKGIKYPENLFFAGQIDLSKFSPFDKSELLPKFGQLIFFANIRNDTGKVVYANIKNEDLIRITKEHDEDFFAGRLIDQVFADKENLSERFRQPLNENEKKYADNEGRIWIEEAGSNKSKIFGIFTHCQYSQAEMKRIIFSDNLVLLQVGENGFNDEGVFSVLINRQDLINMNFENCKFYWGQG